MGQSKISRGHLSRGVLLVLLVTLLYREMASRVALVMAPLLPWIRRVV